MIMLLCLGLILFRTITWRQALGSLNGGILLLFAFADCFSSIMADSGTDDFMASVLESASNGNPYLCVVAMTLVVGLLTQFLNNAACVQLLFVGRGLGEVWAGVWGGTLEDNGKDCCCRLSRTRTVYFSENKFKIQTVPKTRS